MLKGSCAPVRAQMLMDTYDHHIIKGDKKSELQKTHNLTRLVNYIKITRRNKKVDET